MAPIVKRKLRDALRPDSSSPEISALISAFDVKSDNSYEYGIPVSVLTNGSKPLLVQARTVFEALLNWTALSDTSKALPPIFTSEFVLYAAKIDGPRILLRQLLEATTESLERSTTDAALDLVAAIVCAPIPNDPAGNSILQQALKIEYSKLSEYLQKNEKSLATTLIHIQRLVDSLSQLLPQANNNRMTMDMSQPMDLSVDLDNMDMTADDGTQGADLDLNDLTQSQNDAAPDDLDKMLEMATAGTAGDGTGVKCEYGRLSGRLQGRDDGGYVWPGHGRAGHGQL